ncbi:glycosyltransferase family 2 protein [candidate division KSB1 bacterium]|nr:glycosyltransferase family 2 protein [candidate division KSB1 bacterium]
MPEFPPTPLVSVVLPVYNRRHIVQRAIKSVQNQTFQDWELLVMDDGSTDGLENDLAPLVIREKRIRYLKHKNQKVAATRNMGIHAAMGYFVTFLDSDDEFKTGHLEVRVDFMQANPQVDFVHGGAELAGTAESHFVQDAFQPHKRIHLSKCCIGATLFGKKSAFIQSGGFKRLAYSPESEFLPRIKKQFNVQQIDFPTYIYHTGRSDSITSAVKEKYTRPKHST